MINEIVILNDSNSQSKQAISAAKPRFSATLCLCGNVFLPSL